MKEKTFYAWFTIIGLVVPGIFTTLYCIEQVAAWGRFGPYEALMLSPQFYSIALSNHVSTQLLADVVITTLVFFFWAYGEAKRHGMKHFWIYPALTYSVAFSVALPLFFYNRHRAMQLQGERRP